MKTWVFDLDGTLVDSFQHYYQILEGLMRRPISLEEKKSVVAQAPLDFLARNFGAHRVDELMKIVRHQGLIDAESIVTYPGAKELLVSMKNKNVQIAVFTNRDKESSSKIIQCSGLEKLVDHVVTGSCVSAKKPSPEGLHLLQKKFSGPEDSFVMIGDHDCDMQAAQNFGALGVRASWHNYWAEESCPLAQQQFFSFEDFAKWATTSLATNS